MSKKWVTLCLSGCFGVMLGIGGVNSSSLYAAEGKKLAMEGTVFDLKGATSLTIYGNVSDKAHLPVAGAKVTAIAKVKTKKGQTSDEGEATSGNDGTYSLTVQPGADMRIYTLRAEKEGLGKSKKTKLKISADQESDSMIANFQIKKASK